MANPISKPSPKWYRITKSLWSTAENSIIIILLALGYADSSLTMLIYKVVSSFIKQALDAILVSASEDYAPKETPLPYNKADQP